MPLLTKPATELQLLRLRTLAATRDVTCGRAVTLRADRLAALAKIGPKLSQKRAARVIEKWESAPRIEIETEKTPTYLGMYEAHHARRGIFKLSPVDEIIVKDLPR